MIAYSVESQPAFAAFYRRYNDIDIYVEDITLIGLYERVFSRILDGVARIVSVTPLGNRAAVLAEANRLKNDKSRRRFFLVDGDFFWLLTARPRLRSLYTLRCYCFENLAFEHASILEIALTLAPQKASADLKNDFSKAKLLSIVESFEPLFEIYAIAHALKSGCRTVAYSPDRLLLARPNYLPDAKAIRNRIRSVYVELRLHNSRDEILAQRRKVRECLSSHDDRSKFISGKYLLSTLLRWFQAETEFRGKPNQLMSLLLSVSKLQIDPMLAKSLRKVARTKSSP